MTQPTDPPIDHLDLDDALAAATSFLGHPPEVRDYGLLEAALARPRASVFGQDAYPSLDTKAAALLLSLVGNHSLIDGNKRLGWVAMRLFYVLNGSDVSAPTDAAVEFVLSIADGTVTDVDAVAARLRTWRPDVRPTAGDA